MKTGHGVHKDERTAFSTTVSLENNPFTLEI